jgi:hypothetical protein
MVRACSVQLQLLSERTLLKSRRGRFALRTRKLTLLCWLTKQPSLASYVACLAYLKKRDAGVGRPVKVLLYTVRMCFGLCIHAILQ